MGVLTRIPTDKGDYVCEKTCFRFVREVQVYILPQGGESVPCVAHLCWLKMFLLFPPLPSVVKAVSVIKSSHFKKPSFSYAMLAGTQAMHVTCKHTMESGQF